MLLVGGLNAPDHLAVAPRIHCHHYALPVQNKSFKRPIDYSQESVDLQAQSNLLQ